MFKIKLFFSEKNSRRARDLHLLRELKLTLKNVTKGNHEFFVYFAAFFYFFFHLVISNYAFFFLFR